MAKNVLVAPILLVEVVVEAVVVETQLGVVVRVVLGGGDSVASCSPVEVGCMPSRTYSTLVYFGNPTLCHYPPHIDCLENDQITYRNNWNSENFQTVKEYHRNY